MIEFPLFVAGRSLFSSCDYFETMGHCEKPIGHNQKLTITGLSNTKRDVWRTYSDIILLKGLIFYFTTLGEVYKSSLPPSLLSQKGTAGLGMPGLASARIDKHSKH